MARGASGDYFDDERLPGKLKLTLLDKYLPVFFGRTSRLGDVEYVDGFAGAGRYESGREGSPLIAMRIARDHLERHGSRYNLHLFELNKERYDRLALLAKDFQEAGVSVSTQMGDVSSGLDGIVEAAGDRPLFGFLDPCGVGLPFDQVVATANRRSRRAPTELILNFSMEAVRRMGARLRDVDSPGASKTIDLLDTTLGGTWWHEVWHSNPENPGPAVAREFQSRLSHATGAIVVSIPVRREPHHKHPVYHLVFMTRRQDALIAFADALARAQEVYRLGSERRRPQIALFDVENADAGPGPLVDLETKALPVIVENLRNLLLEHRQVRIGDHAIAVLGEHFGEVREPVIRKAVKQLHSQGGSATNGVGTRKVHDIVVVRP